MQKLLFFLLGLFVVIQAQSSLPENDPRKEVEDAFREFSTKIHSAILHHIKSLCNIEQLCPSELKNVELKNDFSSESVRPLMECIHKNFENFGDDCKNTLQQTRQFAHFAHKKGEKILKAFGHLLDGDYEDDHHHSLPEDYLSSTCKQEVRDVCGPLPHDSVNPVPMPVNGDEDEPAENDDENENGDEPVENDEENSDENENGDEPVENDENSAENEGGDEPVENDEESDGRRLNRNLKGHHGGHHKTFHKHGKGHKHRKGHERRFVEYADIAKCVRHNWYEFSDGCQSELREVKHRFYPQIFGHGKFHGMFHGAFHAVFHVAVSVFAILGVLHCFRRCCRRCGRGRRGRRGGRGDQHGAVEESQIEMQSPPPYTASPIISGHPVGGSQIASEHILYGNTANTVSREEQTYIFSPDSARGRLSGINA